MAKEDISANLLKMHLTEDFWGNLKRLVYDKGWKANNLHELETRIRSVMRKIDLSLVQSHCGSVRSRLDAIRRRGLDALYE